MCQILQKAVSSFYSKHCPARCGWAAPRASRDRRTAVRLYEQPKDFAGFSTAARAARASCRLVSGPHVVPHSLSRLRFGFTGFVFLFCPFVVQSHLSEGPRGLWLQCGPRPCGSQRHHGLERSSMLHLELPLQSPANDPLGLGERRNVLRARMTVPTSTAWREGGTKPFLPQGACWGRAPVTATSAPAL